VVAFALDGHTLATAGEGEVTLLWNLTALNALRDNPGERACSLTRGGLDPVQRDRYVPGLAYVDSCAT
jgi:hypothetical protein